MNVCASELEVITVTARKTIENIQETPISVVAFNGDELNEQHIVDLKSLNTKITNVSISGSGGLGANNAAFFIRGIGTTRNAVSQESAVALYVDDAYYGRSDGAILPIMDVEQIEISRGPQGTLFGRSATAGTIRYITNKPDHDNFISKVQLTMSSENKKDLTALLNVPLSDKFAIRVSAASLNQEGHVQGVFTGKDYSNINTDMARGYLSWQIDDSLVVLASLDHTHMNNNGNASIFLGYDGQKFPVVAAEAALGFDITELPIGDYRHSYQTGDNFYHSNNTGMGLVIRKSINQELTLKYASHWRDVDLTGGYDADASHARLFEQSPYQRNITMLSQELQLTGSSENSHWLAGLFYYDEQATDKRLVGLGSKGNPFTFFSNTRITQPYLIASSAAYTQISYSFTPQWSLTTGLRYTKDNKSIVANELNASGEAKLATAIKRQKSWHALSGRLSLEYIAGRDLFIFTSLARGYRAGGFNDRIRTDLPDNFFGITDFNEEILDMYELGLRSELFDRQLRLNLTVFLGEFTDIQIASLIPNTSRNAISNAGEAEIKGLEGELIWAINDTYTLATSWALLNSEYSQLNNNVNSLTLDSNFAHAPKNSFVLALSANFDDIVAHVDYGWKNDFALLEAPAEAVIQKSYGLLNANIRYQTANSYWAISVYANNLTDEEYLISGLNLTTAPPGIIQGEPGRFRELGITFEWLFD